jgi:predicted transposase YbfD/YdcC
MKLKWPGLERYISVRRRGIRDGKEFDTETFYITSEILSAWCFAQMIRYHRKIENTLHWTKDVVLNEDNCGLVNSQQAANMAVMRDTCAEPVEA